MNADTSIFRTDVIEIAPDGDMCLRVEDVQFKVSLNALRSASPVFNAMFKPNSFLEGDMISQSFDSPITLEGDPDAMELLFRVMHGKMPKSKKPEPRLLPHLMILCDKYDCINCFSSLSPVIPPCMQWLHCDPSTLSIDDCAWLLLCSYILDMPDEFTRISAEIVARPKKASEYYKSHAERNEALDSYGLLEPLCKLDSIYIKELGYHLQAPSRKFRGASLGCNKVEYMAQFHHEILKRNNLLLSSVSFRNLGLSNIRDTVTKGWKDFKDAKCTLGNGTPCFCNNKLGILENVLSRLGGLEKKRMRLCWECLNLTGKARCQEHRYIVRWWKEDSNGFDR